MKLSEKIKMLNGEYGEAKNSYMKNFKIHKIVGWKEAVQHGALKEIPLPATAWMSFT